MANLDCNPGSTFTLTDIKNYIDATSGTKPGPQGPQGEKGPIGPPGPTDTPAELLVKIKEVDGSGSGLDADTLDGMDSTSFVKKSGDTMTGNLNMNGKNVNGIADGILTDDAVNKKQLDQVDANVAAKVDKTGDTMTGTLTVPTIKAPTNETFNIENLSTFGGKGTAISDSSYTHNVEYQNGDETIVVMACVTFANGDRNSVLYQYVYGRINGNNVTASSNVGTDGTQTRPSGVTLFVPPNSSWEIRVVTDGSENVVQSSIYIVKGK